MLRAGTMQKIWHDLRYALRGLWRAPAFAAVAIGSLALGIGTNAAVFSVFNSVLVRPFPTPTRTGWQPSSRRTSSVVHCDSRCARRTSSNGASTSKPDME